METVIEQTGTTIHELHAKRTQADTGNFVLNWSADENSAQVWKSIWTMDALKSLHHHEMIQMGE